VGNILEDLNEAQRAAVEFIEGPSLVLAGAGSGKTRVLTYKIAYLLNNKVDPATILALTFTNKAAREMKERIAQLAGKKETKNLWMGTFHSLFARILRIEAKTIGFPQSFTIYDTGDAKSLIKTIVKELKLDDKIYKASHIQSRISLAKNNLLTPEGYANNVKIVQADVMNRMPRVQDIYAIYFNRCKKAGAMDFDDLLLYTNLLFRDHPEILAKYRNVFQYILVDEYQDTNMAQYLIIKKLAEVHQRICVVGDDAQSIYSFRGARVDNILQYPNDFAGCKIFKLDQNYRSTQNIVKAANSLIAKNSNQFEKNNFSSNPAGSKITVLSAYSDIEEAYIVTNTIFEMHMRDHCELRDFAILYRTNAQSRHFEEALRKRNLEYKIYGGLSFYQRKEIKDLLAYMRLAVNQNDDEALKRVINYPPRGIGDTTLSKLDALAQDENVGIFHAIGMIRNYNLGINNSTIARLEAFAHMIDHFRESMHTLDAAEVVQKVLQESGILAEFSNDKSPESLSRKENLEELINAVNEFCAQKKEEGNENSLIDFLQEVSLLTDQDKEEEGEFNKITLMTIHSSKGLEFKHVFVVGMEEELFPSARTLDSPAGLEEERRLFYVAVTRAREICFLTFAKSRGKFGQYAYCTPSRFIRDIDAVFLDLPVDISLNTKGLSNTTEPIKRIQRNDRPVVATGGLSKRTPLSHAKGKNDEKTNFSPDIPALIQVNQRVEHATFGFGTVVRIETNGDIKAVIEFDKTGQKTLLLKFARLRILKDE